VNVFEVQRLLGTPSALSLQNRILFTCGRLDPPGAGLAAS
jgi:hypothetical protein